MSLLNPPYNYLIITYLQSHITKDAYLDFERALVRTQKGIFCKLIRRLLDAKRAYIIFETQEKSLQVDK